MRLHNAPVRAYYPVKIERGSKPALGIRIRIRIGFNWGTRNLDSDPECQNDPRKIEFYALRAGGISWSLPDIRYM